jgi:hypothetical protein
VSRPRSVKVKRKGRADDELSLGPAIEDVAGLGGERGDRPVRRPAGRGSVEGQGGEAGFEGWSAVHEPTVTWLATSSSST